MMLLHKLLSTLRHRFEETLQNTASRTEQGSALCAQQTTQSNRAWHWTHEVIMDEGMNTVSYQY